MPFETIYGILLYCECFLSSQKFPCWELGHQIGDIQSPGILTMWNLGGDPGSVGHRMSTGLKGLLMGKRRGLSQSLDLGPSQLSEF